MTMVTCAQMVPTIDEETVPLDFGGEAGSVENARILVVDDDPTAALLMTRMLERDGFWRVVTAGEGWRALAILLQHPPDVMVLDVHMPDLDGVQVLREMQTLEQHSNFVTGVLAVSGDHSTSVSDRMLRAGADDFIARPFGVVDFAARVRRLAHATHELRRTLGYVGFLERDLCDRPLE
jgi:DNA-binding response OmpR family regulator